jgi:hypothetical protein
MNKIMPARFNSTAQCNFGRTSKSKHVYAKTTITAVPGPRRANYVLWRHSRCQLPFYVPSSRALSTHYETSLIRTFITNLVPSACLPLGPRFDSRSTDRLSWDFRCFPQSLQFCASGDAKTSNFRILSDPLFINHPLYSMLYNISYWQRS